MITVWGRRSSSNVQAVMWCIGELGLSYERIDAGFKYGVTDTDAYLQLNPNGTVPTLKDGEMVVWESGAILRYLASKYHSTRSGGVLEGRLDAVSTSVNAESVFWPNSAEERALVDQWAEWSKINIALQFTGPIFWQVVRVPSDRRDEKKIRAAIDQFESKLAIAEKQLEQHRYIAGSHFTLADIQFAHTLYRYFNIPIERASFNSVNAYYQRMLERSAYRKHVAISYAELIDTM